MPDISGISGSQGPRPIDRRSSSDSVKGSPPAHDASPSDSVEISDQAARRAEVAEFVSKLQELPEVRQERIEAIRQQIQDGTYDIDGKLGSALDGLLDDLGIGHLS